MSQTKLTVITGSVGNTSFLTTASWTDSGHLSFLNRDKCGLRLRNLQQKFIDQQKKASEDFEKRRIRKRRKELWELRHHELVQLCKEVAKSYQVYRHYLAHGPNELWDIGQNTGTYQIRKFNGLFIRSKAFFNVTATAWGRNEAEYYEVTDSLGHIVRRPFWIRIDSFYDDLFITSKLHTKERLAVLTDRYLKPGSQARKEHDERYRNRRPLRTGPPKREEVQDVIAYRFGPPDNKLELDANEEWKPPGLQGPRKVTGFGKPLYLGLDKDPYTKKITNMETVKRDNVWVSLKTTKYMEHSLLVVNPTAIFIKTEWLHGDLTRVDLYDSENVLMETVITRQSGTDTCYIDWIIPSFDVITTIHSVLSAGVEAFVSIFISKKDEYELTIDPNNQATVKIAEKQIMQTDGVIGYKAAVTTHGDLCLIELLIPTSARIASSAYAAGKLRTNKVLPLKIHQVTIKKSDLSSSTNDNDDLFPITSVDVTTKSTNLTEAMSCVYRNSNNFRYEVNKEISLPDWMFSIEMDDICVAGIHYCLTKKEALEFHMNGGQVINKIEEINE